MSAGQRKAFTELGYPAELPVSQKVDEIRKLISEHQVVIIAGETGSGKTTQIPKICLELGRGLDKRIGHTQPRRLAARTVCHRIAEELGTEVGREVGYQVRFQEVCSEQTCLKLMTDGVLLAETRHDPLLKQYDTLIIDEAHERSLNIDFLLGYIKNLLPRRPDLKLIITSATIDVEKFSAHFDAAPVIEVSGRTYPVEILYMPPGEADTDIPAQVIAAAKEIFRAEKQRAHQYRDILVFLSGEREIREVADAIRKEKFPHTEIFPLYARLSNKEQNRVFQPHTGRRIVLATNVAETSLTVPGIAYVIDTGLARISRYSVRSKIQRLPVEAISQASANQRAGRCGRVCPGLCVRLYSEEDYLGRPAFTDTEITRTNLASVILQMESLRLGRVADFPFLDKPETRAINDGYKLLEELGAINSRGQLSKIGRMMANFPVDPKFARMIISAAEKGCLHEVLIIISALSVQDPRERPLDKQQAADEKHQVFRAPDSDFMDFVRLWGSFESQRQSMSQNQLRKYCQQNFLSWMRMREWREVHRQLHLLCQQQGLRHSRQAGSNEDHIHQALLSGLLSQVARLHEDGIYLGARARKYHIFPGSSLFRKKTPWIVSVELVETARLYARTNARVKPEWIEQAAKHLIRKQYFEPYWSRRQGRVMAYEKVSLYGLVLVEKRRTSYGAIDPVLSREVFIRQALVEHNLNTRLAFYHRNRQLIDKVSAIEEKTRRRDILVDEEVLFRFYDERLPADVLDAASLERWYRKLAKTEAVKLELREEDLIKPESKGFDLQDYPDQLKMANLALKLDYEFEPGHRDDGVSLDLPVSALKQLREDELDWLVPGMLREKCIALIRALPKNLRKNFVPVPDVVDRVLPLLRSKGESREGSLRNLLARQLSVYSGLSIDPQIWQDHQLDPHLEMNIRVLDEHGNLLGSGRSLTELREEFSAQVQQSIQRNAHNTIEQDSLQGWSFGELPAVYRLQHAGLGIDTYPALIDEGESVALRLLDSSYAAEKASRKGVLRLLMLQSRDTLKYLRKILLQNPQQVLLLTSLGRREDILDMLIQSACQGAFLEGAELPRTESAFQAVYERGRSELVSRAERHEAILCKVMASQQRVQKQLRSFKGLSDMPLQEDVRMQLEALIYPGFMTELPPGILPELPRYLQALEERLAKYPRQQDKDRQLTAMLQTHWQAWLQRKQSYERQERASAALDDFRWMLEELRVSLFAQTLGTRFPVSEKRLLRAWEQIAP